MGWPALLVVSGAALFTFGVCMIFGPYALTIVIGLIMIAAGFVIA